MQYVLIALFAVLVTIPLALKLTDGDGLPYTHEAQLADAVLLATRQTVAALVLQAAQRDSAGYLKKVVPDVHAGGYRAQVVPYRWECQTPNYATHAIVNFGSEANCTDWGSGFGLCAFISRTDGQPLRLDAAWLRQRAVAAARDAALQFGNGLQMAFDWGYVQTSASSAAHCFVLKP